MHYAHLIQRVLTYQIWRPNRVRMVLYGIYITTIEGLLLGPMKGGWIVGCRLEILRNVRCRLGIESVQCQAEWSVQCRAGNSECRCRPKLILVWMSVSAGKSGTVSNVGNTPFMGPTSGVTYKHGTNTIIIMHKNQSRVMRVKGSNEILLHNSKNTCLRRWCWDGVEMVLRIGSLAL